MHIKLCDNLLFCLVAFKVLEDISVSPKRLRECAKLTPNVKIIRDNGNILILFQWTVLVNLGTK